ncbi:methyltransferase [Oceanobacillus bengalensis]|uniref:Methyltransferase n=1 Tax=Oceanobacillus bengalensis TaxID=1435466 RepID=A0A494YUC3_9BACI|nr:methyltransferase [Oceanobacillus bengalensis]RKQ13659.1 methyltransferase [Oceanobacillus bengalensis]
MQEFYYDKLLNINTRKDAFQPINNAYHYYPYEPTPYQALETLFEQYEVTSNDHIVDFGCGKGRLNFYIHYFYRAAVTGIEMNERFYHDAIHNLEGYTKQTKQKANRIQFHCCLAEEYSIKPTDNRFYFFNPFSIQIFRKIVHHILLSVEEAKRDIELILYYGYEDYVYFLEDETAFELVKEIKLPHLYEKSSYERFLIYRL